MSNKLFWGKQPFTPFNDRYADQYLGTEIASKLWCIAEPCRGYKSKAGKPQYDADKCAISFISGVFKGGFLLLSGVKNITQILPLYSEDAQRELEANARWVKDGMLLAIDCSDHAQLTWLHDTLGDTVFTAYIEVLTDNTTKPSDDLVAVVKAIAAGDEVEDDALLQLSDYGAALQPLVKLDSIRMDVKQLERANDMQYVHITDVTFDAPDKKEGGGKRQRLDLIAERAKYMGAFMDTVEGETLTDKLAKIYSDVNLLNTYLYHISIATGTGTIRTMLEKESF